MTGMGGMGGSATAGAARPVRRARAAAAARPARRARAAAAAQPARRARRAPAARAARRHGGLQEAARWRRRTSRARRTAMAASGQLQHSHQERPTTTRATCGGRRGHFVGAEGRVHLRHHPLRHVPVGARHEPRRVQGHLPRPDEHHLSAPSAQPRDRHADTTASDALSGPEGGARSSCSPSSSGISRAGGEPQGLEELVRRLRQQPARLHGRAVRDRGARHQPRTQRHARDDHRRQVARVHDNKYQNGQLHGEPVLGHHRAGVRLHVDRGRRSRRRSAG